MLFLHRKDLSPRHSAEVLTLEEYKMAVLTCLCQNGTPSAHGPGGDVPFTMTGPLWQG